MASISRCLLVATSGLLCAFNAAAQDVTLSTSGPCYAPGETISFILMNNRDSAIYMLHSPVWDVFESATGAYVAPSPIFPSIVEFDGRRSATYTWNQRDYDDHPVGVGEYRVEVQYSARFNPWNSTTVAATFEIGRSCPTTDTDQTDWDHFKSLFR